MKLLSCLLALLPAALPLRAAEDAAPPAAVAQQFYDGYMKVLLANGDPSEFVLTSKAVTGPFRDAYKKLLEDGMDSDPIFCGQDYPDGGFIASEASIAGGKARVTMKSRGDALKHSFEVTLKQEDGVWRISDTNDLKADAND